MEELHYPASLNEQKLNEELKELATRLEDVTSRLVKQSSVDALSRKIDDMKQTIELWRRQAERVGTVLTIEADLASWKAQAERVGKLAGQLWEPARVQKQVEALQQTTASSEKRIDHVLSQHTTRIQDLERSLSGRDERLNDLETKISEPPWYRGDQADVEDDDETLIQLMRDCYDHLAGIDCKIVSMFRSPAERATHYGLLNRLADTIADYETDL